VGQRLAQTPATAGQHDPQPIRFLHQAETHRLSLSTPYRSSPGAFPAKSRGAM
jgi:hypothetical protein